MSSAADPFLLQKLEFLELELQESKEREAKLKKTYDSLLSLMNVTSPTFGSHTEDEIDKVKSAYQKELEDVRQRAKQDYERLEEDQRSLRTRCKEMELELKQSLLSAEREKAELRHRLSNKTSDAEERDRSDLERRLLGLKTQFEQYKENAIREKEKLLRDCETKVKDAANAYNQEKGELMTLISHAEAKTAEQREKLASLKSECDTMKAEMRVLKQENDSFKANRPTKRYKDAVEEEKQRLLSQVQSLQGKIQSYSVRSSSRGKPTSRESASDRPVSELALLRAQITKAEKTIEMLKTDLAEEKKKVQTMQLSPHSLCSDDSRPVCTSQSTARQSRGDDSLLVDKLKDQLIENSHALETAKDNLRDSKVETAQLQLQNERLQIDLEKMNIESKQMKLDWSVEREKLLEEIRKLKTEVKFLIGKLVKAKGKLAVEGELTDTLKEDPARSKSVNRSRLSARPASPQRHCVSPLNLSAITRAESPCWNRSLDVI